MNIAKIDSRIDEKELKDEARLILFMLCGGTTDVRLVSDRIVPMVFSTKRYETLFATDERKVAVKYLEETNELEWKWWNGCSWRFHSGNLEQMLHSMLHVRKMFLEDSKMNLRKIQKSFVIRRLQKIADGKQMKTGGKRF